MERLPLELVWLVYEHLEEYDLAPTPYSAFTEEPCNQFILVDTPARRRWYNSSWLRFTEASRADIQNARLASSVFYGASYRIFAKLLADRTFRFTNVGFQDLILISRKKELLQYVRTLTLGCAAFRRNMGINDSGFVWPCTFLSGLKMEDRSRLASSYMQCRDWQHDNMEAHTERLASIFCSLPNLESMRVLTVDPVFHLGGWLKPGDEDLLSKDHFHFQDRSSEALNQHYNRNMHPRMYTNESSVIRDCIIEAIRLSKLALRDFRSSPKPPILDLNRAPFITSALHTLRIVLAKGSMVWFDLDKLFSNVTGLRDLSLVLEDTCSDPDDRSSVVIRKTTGQLFQLLERQPQLRRLELSGNWIIPEAALIDFAKSHAETLRCLILHKPMLRGNWDSTLKAIARITHGKAAFLKVWLPSLTSEPELERWSGADWEASLGFSYPIVWITEP
jgi:hypothetical protein